MSELLARDRTFYAFNAVLSAAALGFLAWLLLINQGAGIEGSTDWVHWADDPVYRRDAIVRIAIGYLIGNIRIARFEIGVTGGVLLCALAVQFVLDNFHARWSEIVDLYDERFFRLWTYYLCCFAGAFGARTLQTWDVVLSKVGGRGRYRSLR